MPFTEEDRRTAIRSCRYCPMCHHADLVTTITRRETYSARGRGLTLFAVGQKKLAWDASVADVLYKFPADGLLPHVCAGHIRHDDMVIDGRRRLVEAGAAPAEVLRVRENLERTGNPWGEPEPVLPSGGRGDLLVYFGPAARVKRPSVMKALVKLLEKAGTAFTTLEKEGDPGLLAHQLGIPSAAPVIPGGIKTVLTPDPDAYRVLKAGFGDVPALQGVKVLHVSEWLEGLALKFLNPGRKILYHDPCALARFAPCIEPPRAFLKALTGSAPLELGWSRDRASCAGECGGLPFTNPGLARAAADRLLAQAREAGADLVVTGSPAAAHLLGNGALDLAEFAAESVP